ncbi:MAG: copper-binding protein [Nitrosopumilus sp.]|uniref:copper-binding protein n=1 Tax=Nitrosopumilus sp. TaxID=2024843 RepID=UPI00242CD831|nr:copper-binding protein [Nitrosopumilus sp.]MCV0366398.1 copper-binding protein [Nitrosopumilus sp.]
MLALFFTPAFAQIQTPITVSTDKTSYSEDDIILVTGEVRDLYSGTPVSLIVKNDNEIITLAQIIVGADKKFSTEITASETLRTAGTYTVEVTYGTQNRMATTSFGFEGSTTSPSDDSSIGFDNRIPVEGFADVIGYNISGANLLGIFSDMDSSSLIVNVDAFNDGTISISIPRSIIDAKIGNDDSEFIILIDGEPIEYDETSSSPTYRIITIVLPVGSEEIEIIGTSLGKDEITTPNHTPSDNDWQNQYFEVLSDFNNASAKIGELQKENQELKNQITELEHTVDNLNAVIREQIKVIYDWILSR